MSQTWCVTCQEFVTIESGKCVLCNSVIKGFVPVPTGRSSPKRVKIDHVKTLSSADVAEMFGIRSRIVTEMAHEGKMPAVLSGGVWVFDRKALLDWERIGRPTAREAGELYARARSVA